MISNTAEYALRAIVCLAEANDEARTADQIAEITKVPRGYLSKIMKELARARVVRSRRGPNGGFTLIKRPEELSFFDVVNAIDPIRRFKVCPREDPHHCAQLCPLHRRLDAAIIQFEVAFRNTSIAELLWRPGPGDVPG